MKVEDKLRRKLIQNENDIYFLEESTSITTLAMNKLHMAYTMFKNKSQNFTEIKSLLLEAKMHYEHTLNISQQRHKKMIKEAIKQVDDLIEKIDKKIARKKNLQL